MLLPRPCVQVPVNGFLFEVNIPDDFYTHLKDQSFMSWRKCSAGGLVINVFGEVQRIADVSGNSRILRVIENLIFLYFLLK